MIGLGAYLCLCLFVFVFIYVFVFVFVFVFVIVFVSADQLLSGRSPGLLERIKCSGVDDS